VNCSYFDVESLNIENLPRYISDDIICDIRVKTEIKTNMCNQLYNGGIYCNNYNMETLSDNQCTDSEVETAWNITSFGNELLMLRVDQAATWWYVEADRFSNAYEWEAAVDLHSKRYWLFEFDDIAWQDHGDADRL